MIGLAYGPAPTIPGVYVLTLVILVRPQKKWQVSIFGLVKFTGREVTFPTTFFEI